MKGGDAVMLKLAADRPRAQPRPHLHLLRGRGDRARVHNGLRKLAESDPDLMEADFAILMEPSNAVVEAGCQGTMRVDVRTTGERAHSRPQLEGRQRDPQGRRRSSRGSTTTTPASPSSTGWSTTRASTPIGIRGGVAGNVLPDECVVEVNFRFAPDRSEADAEAFVRDFFEGYDVTVTDSRRRARCPGSTVPAAKAFVEAVGGEVNPKFGWTDVARFTALGVPAVNFGPGDPMFAHKQEEHVPDRAHRALRAACSRSGWRERPTPATSTTG